MNKKISELPAATLPLSGSELMEVVQGGINKQVAKSDVATGGGGTVTSVTGTTNRITSTGGTTPVIDIDAAYDAALTNAINAKVADAINDGTTTIAPSQNAVFDALALKQVNIGSDTPSTAGATITLDMNSLRQRIFVGSASFATAKTLALSNDSVAFLFSFIFQVTNVAAVITMPTTFLMTDPNFDGDDWTPAVIGTYEIGGTWNGTNWIVKIAGPFV